MACTEHVRLHWPRDLHRLTRAARHDAAAAASDTDRLVSSQSTGIARARSTTKTNSRKSRLPFLPLAPPRSPRVATATDAK